VPLVDNNDVNPLTKRLKGRWWKDMGLFTQNMKSCIFRKAKNISNQIVGCNFFPAMGAMKKVGPCRILKLATMEWVTLRVKGCGRSSLVHNAKEKISKVKQKGGMIG